VVFLRLFVCAFLGGVSGVLFDLDWVSETFETQFPVFNLHILGFPVALITGFFYYILTKK